MTDLVERFSTESLLLPDSGARVMRPRLHTVDVHWHDHYELCLVVSGEAEHVVNGVARPIGRGSAFLLSPADFHAIQPVGHEPLCCYNTVVDPGLMERQLAALVPPPAGDLPWCRRTTSASGSGTTPARPSRSTCRNAVCGSRVPCSRRPRCP
nr:AraC family ligand binding domain-containing protein [Microbispora sp. ATCC PTA-5024]